MDSERRFLPLLFVVTGTCNVLLLKWSNNMLGECGDGQWRRFQHPVVQTFFMFLGQFLCFVLYKLFYFFLKRRENNSHNEHLLTRGEREFSPLIFLLPAFLDAIASLLLFTGLYLTYASSFQMIRGAALMFAGIFGSIYLNQTLSARHWMAMFTISSGILIIITTDLRRVFYDRASLVEADANSVLTGNLLVLCAQILHAGQFVYEEKRLKAIEIPALHAAGWQGIFGLFITMLLGICMNFLPAQFPFGENSRGVFDDIGDVVSQLHSNLWLAAALGMFVLSCACYNYVALSIVKFSSTANRILADGLRALFVWWAALLLEWELLNLITCMGFVIIIMGTVAYRNAIFLDWYRSLVARMANVRYSGFDSEHAPNTGSVPASRPADLI